MLFTSKVVVVRLLYLKFSMDDNWCTIESDPGVFTEIIERIGVKNVVFDEILSLQDESAIVSFDKIHGLIFLFKYSGDHKSAEGVTEGEDFPGVFFAKQMINNACASQAILSVLLNSDIPLDTEISNFRAFMLALDPESRGLAIGNFEKLKVAHNAFRARASLEISRPEIADSVDAEDVFHFVAYVKTPEGIFELDGLSKGPVRIGDIEGKWVQNLALPHIRNRVSAFNESEIRFNLLALVDDPSVNNPEHPIVEKKEKWRAENSRRKHDFTPAVIAVLERLARSGKLSDILTKLEADADPSP